MSYSQAKPSPPLRQRRRHERPHRVAPRVLERAHLDVSQLCAGSLQQPGGVRETDAVPEPEVHVRGLRHHVDMGLAHLLGADAERGGTVAQADDLDGLWEVVEDDGA